MRKTFVTGLLEDLEEFRKEHEPLKQDLKKLHDDLRGALAILDDLEQQRITLGKAKDRWEKLLYGEQNV